MVVVAPADSTCTVQPASIANRSSACASERHRERAHPLAAERERDLGVRPPHEVDGGGRRAPRPSARPPTRSARRPLGAPSASASAAPSAAWTSSTVWCSSTSTSPAASELEIEPRVEGEQRQQVVEEPEPVSTRARPRPVERERQAERGLGRRADDGRLAAAALAGLRAERAQEDVVLRRPPDGRPDPSGNDADDDALRLEALRERLVGADEDEVRRSRRAVVARRRAALPASARAPRSWPRRRRGAARAARRPRSPPPGPRSARGRGAR